MVASEYVQLKKLKDEMRALDAGVEVKDAHEDEKLISGHGYGDAERFVVKEYYDDQTTEKLFYKVTWTISTLLLIKLQQ